MAKVRRLPTFYVELRGKRYRVVPSTNLVHERSPSYGVCDHPKTFSKEIRLDVSEPGAVIEAVLHEVLHACLWDLDEAAVSETASCQAHVLQKVIRKWRLGNR